MTKEQLKIPAWAVTGIVAALLAVGAARVQLGQKEDAADHKADVLQLQSAIQSVRVDAEKRTIRDSASAADVMRILRDLAGCPRSDKDYCNK